MTDRYVVTERAGRRVAGVHVRPGDELTLTAAEAAHELREGTIVRKGASLESAFHDDSASLTALRARARGEDVAVPPGPPAGAAAEAAPESAVEMPSKPPRKGGKEG